jgi:hypothetical protein
MTRDHVQLLTFSQGVVADWERRNQVAAFLAPEVVVGGGVFHYKDYGLGNAFTPIDMRRAVGGPSKMLSLAVADVSDINREYSLATFIDDQERENNPQTIGVLEQRKITDLVNTVMNNNLYLVLQQARTLTAYTVGGGANQIPAPFTGGAWTNTANDPVNDINLICKRITDTYGIMPNRIYFDSQAWIIYINNPLVRGRFQGVLIQAVTPTNAATMWNIPLDCKVNQGALYEGGSGKSDVIVFFGQDAPGQFDTSFMKTFVNVAGRFTRIRSWRDEDTSSDKYKATFYQNIKLTGQATAIRITVS